MKWNEGQREGLLALYGEMTDSELLGLEATEADLTEVAQEALASEMKRREIEAAAIEETLPADGTPEGKGSSEWVTLHVFAQTFEAQAAFKLLEREEIEFAVEDRTLDKRGQLRAGPAVQLALLVHRYDRDQAMTLLRSKAGLFPEAVVDPRGEDVDCSGEMVTVGEFEDQADVAAASRVLGEAGVWFRVVTHAGEEWERTSMEVKEEDSERALETLEPLLEEDAHRL